MPEIVEMPDMPVHDAIGDDGNGHNIDLLCQFIEFVAEECTLLDSRGMYTTSEEKRKLAFKFLEYDYDAWVKEKDELVKLLQATHRNSSE